MAEMQFSLDFVGVDDHWISVTVDLAALRSIVCQVLRVPATDCGPPIRVNPKSEGQEQGYARVYSFQAQSRSVIARVVAPVRPLFKTEAEVAAMEFVRSRSSYTSGCTFTLNISQKRRLFRFQESYPTARSPIILWELNGYSWSMFPGLRWKKDGAT